LSANSDAFVRAILPNGRVAKSVPAVILARISSVSPVLRSARIIIINRARGQGSYVKLKAKTVIFEDCFSGHGTFFRYFLPILVTVSSYTASFKGVLKVSVTMKQPNSL
jgi:hypothetical protein